MAIGPVQLLIVVLLVVLVFGTKKLRSLGSDLGASLKGFKKAMSDDDEEKQTPDADFAAKSLPDEPMDSTHQTASKHDKEQV